MKNLLILGVAFLYTTSADPDLSNINSLRKRLSEASGVAISPLKWDAGLVSKAKTLSNNCTELMKRQDDYSGFPDAPDANAAKLQAFYYKTLATQNFAELNTQNDLLLKSGLIGFESFDEPPLDELKTTFLEFQQKVDIEREEAPLNFELFNPKQNKIGCVQVKCSATFPVDLTSKQLPIEIRMTDKKYTFNQVCVMAPGGRRIEPSDFQASNKIWKAFPKVEEIQKGKFSIDLSSSSAASFTTLISIALSIIFFM